jgi:hypothetical protein
MQVPRLGTIIWGWPTKAKKKHIKVFVTKATNVKYDVNNDRKEPCINYQLPMIKKSQSH